MYIFLDESGCLGFDFNKKATSKYFIVTLLVIKSEDVRKQFKKAVIKTNRNKVIKSRKLKNQKDYLELKGTNTIIDVKKYFWKQIKDQEFEKYSLIVDKNTVHERLRKNRDRFYNYLSRLIIEKVKFKGVNSITNIIIDRSKSRKEVVEFNKYLLIQLSYNTSRTSRFNLEHVHSADNKWLQAVDLFCWGIHRKYEYEDIEWYNVFKDKIKYEELYFRNHSK